MDAIITSPPYIDLIDYIDNDSQQIANLFSFNYIKKLRKKPIGTKLEDRSLTEKLYWQKMNIVFNEIRRILKLKSQFIIVIGSYMNMKEKYMQLAMDHDLYIERILKREVFNLKNYKNIEYVLFLRKN